MKRPIILVCCTCLLAMAACSSTEKYEQFNIGNHALYPPHKDLDSALRVYTRVLLKDSTMVQAANNRGNVWQYRDSLKMAIADYAPVVFDRPEEPEAFFNRAKVWQRQRNWSLAITDYTIALHLIRDRVSDDLAAEIKKADFGYSLDGLAFLKIPYGRAVKEALLNRGVCNHLAWAFTSALLDLHWAIHLDPCDPEGYFQRGNCYQSLAMRTQGKQAAGYFQAALDDYAMTDSLLPDTGVVERLLSQRANCHLAAGRIWEASLDYDKLLTYYPEHAGYNFKAGNCYQAQKDYNNAYLKYTTAIVYDSTMAVAYFNRGNCLFVLGELGLAAADYSLVVQLLPKYGDAYYMRGITRADLGDREGAMADLQSAGELGHPEAFAELGILASTVLDTLAKGK